MKKYFGIIYKATNKVNGKVYIGQTTGSFKKRRNYHENTKEGYCFQQAIRKHGKDNFEWGIIKYCNSRKELNNMESYYIDKYDSLCNGYNLTLGGDGSCGWKPSEETKRKISKSKKGKLVGSENPFYGKNHSEEARQKMTGSRYNCRGKNHHMYGKKHSKEVKMKIGAASKGRNVGRKHTETAKNKIRMAHLGKKKGPFSLETRKKMSRAHLGNKVPQVIRDKMAKSKSHSWLLTFPDGSKKIIRNLRKFCDENNLSRRALYAVVDGKRRHHKNYCCQKLYDIEIRRIECL